MPSNALKLASLAALALCVILILPVATAQNTPEIEEFKLPDSAAIDAMCLDSQGNVWLAQSSPAVLYKFDVTAKAFEKHEVPATGDAMFKGMSAEGSDYIWMADQPGQKIYGYDINKDKFYNFTFPVKLDPADVIAWDHYLWVACNMELGRLDMETNFLKDYYVDKYTAGLTDLVIDRMGNVWFVECSTGKVGGYRRMDDQVQLFSIPTTDSAPTCPGIDPQGRLWFIESGPNKLGMFDTAMSSFKEFDMPSLDGVQVNPKRLAVDGDGNVWLTDMPHDRVIKYYPSKDAFVPISLNGSKVYLHRGR
jgi:virginiamycin B lyase